MDPDHNGYLARHLQGQFYFNYYNPASILQFRYNYGLNQILMPHVPSSISNPSVNPLQNAFAISIESNLGKQQAPKKKRLTKKLVFIDIRNEIMKKSKNYQSLKKSLHYLDPCRAPPITTLRNDAELQYDYHQELKKGLLFNNQTFPTQSSSEITLRNLQILIKAPDQHNYPFLICKKRKYYRNLKRRYSVTYFKQRAYFISHQIPIPFKLEPKHKNRKHRLKRISSNDQIHSSSDPSSNSESIISYESYEEAQKPQKLSGRPKNVNGIQKAQEVKKETLDSAQINHLSRQLIQNLKDIQVFD